MVKAESNSNKCKVQGKAELCFILKYNRILPLIFLFKKAFFPVFAMGESVQRKETKQK